MSTGALRPYSLVQHAESRVEARELRAQLAAVTAMVSPPPATPATPDTLDTIPATLPGTDVADDDAACVKSPAAATQAFAASNLENSDKVTPALLLFRFVFHVR